MRLCRCDCSMAAVSLLWSWPLPPGCIRLPAPGHAVCVIGCRMSVRIERYVLSLALVVPLAVGALGVGQLTGIGVAAPASPSSIVRSDAAELGIKRPIVSEPQ